MSLVPGPIPIDHRLRTHDDGVVSAVKVRWISSLLSELFEVV